MKKTATRWLLCIVLVLALTASFALTACHKTYTATFVGGDGATGTAPAPIESEGEITLPQNTFTRDGYTFSGWSDGSETYQAGATYTLTKDTEFTAQWTQNGPAPAAKYTLTFALGDHAASDATAPAAQQLEAGAEYTLPDGPKAADGYTFAGWGASKLAAGSQYTMPASDTTLTAQWTSNGSTPVSDGIPQEYQGEWVTFPVTEGEGSKTATLTEDKATIGTTEYAISDRETIDGTTQWTAHPAQGSDLLLTFLEEYEPHHLMQLGGNYYILSSELEDLTPLTFDASYHGKTYADQTAQVTFVIDNEGFAKLNDKDVNILTAAKESDKLIGALLYDETTLWQLRVIEDPHAPTEMNILNLADLDTEYHCEEGTLQPTPSISIPSLLRGEWHAAYGDTDIHYVITTSTSLSFDGTELTEVTKESNYKCSFTVDGTKWTIQLTSDDNLMVLDDGEHYYFLKDESEDAWPLSDLKLPSGDPLIGQIYENATLGNLAIASDGTMTIGDVKAQILTNECYDGDGFLYVLLHKDSGIWYELEVSAADGTITATSPDGTDETFTLKPDNFSQYIGTWKMVNASTFIITVTSKDNIEVNYSGDKSTFAATENSDGSYSLLSTSVANGYKLLRVQTEADNVMLIYRNMFNNWYMSFREGTTTSYTFPDGYNGNWGENGELKIDGSTLTLDGANYSFAGCYTNGDGDKIGYIFDSTEGKNVYRITFSEDTIRTESISNGGRKTYERTAQPQNPILDSDKQGTWVQIGKSKQTIFGADGAFSYDGTEYTFTAADDSYTFSADSKSYTFTFMEAGSIVLLQITQGETIEYYLKQGVSLPDETVSLPDATYDGQGMADGMTLTIAEGKVTLGDYPVNIWGFETDSAFAYSNDTFFNVSIQGDTISFYSLNGEMTFVKHKEPEPQILPEGYVLRNGYWGQLGATKGLEVTFTSSKVTIGEDTYPVAQDETGGGKYYYTIDETKYYFYALDGNGTDEFELIYFEYAGQDATAIAFLACNGATSSDPTLPAEYYSKQYIRETDTAATFSVDEAGHVLFAETQYSCIGTKEDSGTTYMWFMDPETGICYRLGLGEDSNSISLYDYAEGTESTCTLIETFSFADIIGVWTHDGEEILISDTGKGTSTDQAGTIVGSIIIGGEFAYITEFEGLFNAQKADESTLHFSYSSSSHTLTITPSASTDTEPIVCTERRDLSNKTLKDFAGKWTEKDLDYWTISETEVGTNSAGVTEVTYLIVDKYIIIDYLDNMYRGGRYVLTMGADNNTLEGFFIKRTQNGWNTEVNNVTLHVYEGEEEESGTKVYTGNVDITLRDYMWREIGKLVITEIDIVTNEKGQQSAIVKGNVEGGQTFETAVEFSPVDEQYWPEDSSGYYTLLDFDAGGNTLTINISFKSDGTLSVHDDVDTYLGTLTQA